MQAVGPEHFGIVSVDCAKRRSKWMLCNFYGKVVIEPTTVEHTTGGLRLMTQLVAEVCQAERLTDTIVAVEMTGIYHKPVQRAFTPAALIGFEKLLGAGAEPVVEDIRKKIAASDGAVHADETYWVLDGQRAYYWLHATQHCIHFQFDTSRAGEVSRDLLGPDFAGTLVTDCYSAYDAQGAKAKQKCLSHLARTARDWQKLTAPDSPAFRFFEAVKDWVRRGCEFHRRRQQLAPGQQADEGTWLREELRRLQICAVDHDKSATLQERIKRYADCWLVFLDDPRVPPTNNHAERCLRPLVILRKITFGHRTESGTIRMARIMTIQETAKRHGRRVLDVIYRLATEFPQRVLRYIYGGPGMAGS